MTTIYIVRHGESITNLEKRFAGQLDVPLTEKGREQAKLTAEYLRDMPLTAIYSSDLQRAYETAQRIAALHNISITLAKGLREIDAGMWQGRLVEDLPKAFPEDFRLWKTAVGLATCSGGESMLHLQQRAVASLQSIVKKYPNDSVCIVAHGGVIRVLLAYITDTPLAELHKGPTWVTNASVSVVTYDGENGYQLVHRDLHGHLDALGTETLNAL